MFLAKDGGLTFKPLEWAVGASGVSRHVQHVRVGVWVAGCGYRRVGGGRGGRKKGGGGGGGEGKARLPSLRGCSLVGEAKEFHDDRAPDSEVEMSSGASRVRMVGAWVKAGGGVGRNLWKLWRD